MSSPLACAFSTGLLLGRAALAIAAASAGVTVGAVITLLGVASGELIVPTLVLVLGVIQTAGTMSLLISIPTMLVGFERHRARGAFQKVSDLGVLRPPG